MRGKLFEKVTRWVKQHPYITGSGFLALIGSLLLQRPILLFLFTAVMLALYLPARSPIFSSVSARIILSLTVITGLVQLEALTFWLLDFWVSSTIYAVTTTVLVLIWLIKVSPELTPTVRFQPWAEAAIVVPCLLIGSAYVVKTFARNDDRDTAIIRSISFGMDDATHAHMVADMLQHDNNILSGEKRQDTLSRSVTRTYPMGWHLTAGVVINSTFGQQERTAMQNVSAYFYAKVASLIYALSAIGLLVYGMFRKLYKRASTAHGALLSIVSTLFVSFILVLPLFYEGFFSFMPILAFTALFMLLLVGDEEGPTFSRVALLGLLAAASSTSWVLTGPMLLAAFAWHCLSSVPSWRQLPWYAYAVFIVGTGAFLAQSYIILTAGKGMVTQLTTSGGITAPDHMLLLAGFGAFALLFFVKDKTWRDTARRLLPLIVSFSAALAAVFCYIALESNEITYYYFKIQSVLLLPLVILLAVFVSIAALRLAEQEKHTLTRYASLIITPVALCLLIPGLVGYPYFRDAIHRSKTFGMAPHEASVLSKQILGEEATAQNERSFFVVPDQAPLNILGSNTARLAYPLVGCDYDIFNAVYGYNLAQLNKELQRCTPKLPVIEIYTNKAGEQQLRKAIQPQLMERNEVEITVL